MFCLDESYGEMIMKRTDSIRFSQKMSREMEKHSCEYQALAILKLVLGEKRKGFIKADSPDLQNINTREGIEVVTSFPESFRYVRNKENELSEALNKGDYNNVNKIEKKLSEVSWVKRIENSILYPANDSIESSVILNTIIKKSNKILDYKVNGFDTIGLFVWHLSPVATEFYNNIAEEWGSLLKEAECYYINKFDFIIITVENMILYYDKDFVCKDTIKLPFIYSSILPVLGRMAAEGMISDDDPIWK